MIRVGIFKVVFASAQHESFLLGSRAVRGSFLRCGREACMMRTSVFGGTRNSSSFVGWSKLRGMSQSRRQCWVSNKHNVRCTYCVLASGG